MWLSPFNPNPCFFRDGGTITPNPRVEIPEGFETIYGPPPRGFPSETYAPVVRYLTAMRDFRGLVAKPADFSGAQVAAALATYREWDVPVPIFFNSKTHGVRGAFITDRGHYFFAAVRGVYLYSSNVVGAFQWSMISRHRYCFPRLLNDYGKIAAANKENCARTRQG